MLAGKLGDDLEAAPVELEPVQEMADGWKMLTPRSKSISGWSKRGLRTAVAENMSLSGGQVSAAEDFADTQRHLSPGRQAKGRAWQQSSYSMQDEMRLRACADGATKG